MRAVVQRVKEARVLVGGQEVASIGPGLLVFLGVGREDSLEDARYLAEKIAHLRIFSDAQGKMNLSLKDVGGQALVVSQFTLYGDCRQGRRPSFTQAAPPEQAKELYDLFILFLKEQGIQVATGEFQANMLVRIENQSPVTLLLDSRKLF
ncbi:MAG TPA: D-tyrosyl-tRNA(Tyr) deacylase [Moorella mulderi]|nr:D-tyrosyl-tRNA(Tyr) deacylase [Moorella mulderi]